MPLALCWTCGRGDCSATVSSDHATPSRYGSVVALAKGLQPEAVGDGDDGEGAGAEQCVKPRRSSYDRVTWQLQEGSWAVTVTVSVLEAWDTLSVDAIKMEIAKGVSLSQGA